MRSLVVVVVVALAASVCGVLSADSCPDTVNDGDSMDGIDLPAPEWLPAEIVLPDGLSIRHINTIDNGSRVLTAFSPGADASTLVGTFRDSLADYRILLAAEGFIPVANPVIVAVDRAETITVWLDLSTTVAPSRDGDTCPLGPGVLVGLRLEAVGADTLSQFDGALLAPGSATATVADLEFAAGGECFVLGDVHQFSSTDGDLIGLHFETGSQAGSASVDAEGLYVFNLDNTRPHAFEVTPDGFGAWGSFIDGLGDRGVVDGEVTVSCG